MHITIFGASGPTGRLVVEQALAAGHSLTAVTRRPDAFPMHSPRLRIAQGDVTDPRDVERAVAQAEAVISTFGVPYSARKITVYSQGIGNIIRSMDGHGVTRLVCVSSTTVAEGDAPGESLLWRRALIPVLRHVVGRTLYDDMQRMETLVRESDLSWTIVRPAGLFDATRPSDDHQVATHRLRGRFTSRADLAETLISAATTLEYSRATIEVVTRTGLPTAATFLASTFGGSPATPRPPTDAPL